MSGPETARRAHRLALQMGLSYPTALALVLAGYPATFQATPKKGN